LDGVPRLCANPCSPHSPWLLVADRGQAAIKSTIYEHPEFAAFIGRMNALFDGWQQQTAPKLKALQLGFHPKHLIVDLSENLLAHYTGQPLIDQYAVYQHLMDYWATTLQDDAYLIAADGWKAETYRDQSRRTRMAKSPKPWTRAGPATWCPRR
jgi:type I restriction enzyme M protein